MAARHEGEALEPAKNGFPKPTSEELLHTEDKEGENLLIVGRKKKSSQGPPKTFRPPRSSVLRQAQSFLPQMAAADVELQKALKEVPPSALDMENTEGVEGPLIEMSLAVLETEPDWDSDVSSDSESDCESGDSNSSTDNMIPLCGEVNEHNIRLSRPSDGATSRPKIEVLPDGATVPGDQCKDTSTPNVVTLEEASTSVELSPGTSNNK